MTFLLADVIRWKWFLQWFVQRFSAVLRQSHTVAVNTSIWTTSFKKEINTCILVLKSGSWQPATTWASTLAYVVHGIGNGWHEHRSWERYLIKEMWHHAAVRKMFLKALAAQGFSNRCFTAIWVCLCVYVCEEGGDPIKIYQSNVKQEIPNHSQQPVLDGFKPLLMFLFNCKVGRTAPFKGSKNRCSFDHDLSQKEESWCPLPIVAKKWVKSLFGKRKIDLFIFLFALITFRQ